MRIQDTPTIWLKSYRTDDWYYILIQQPQGLLVKRKLNGQQVDDHFHNGLVMSKQEADNFMRDIYEVSK